MNLSIENQLTLLHDLLSEHLIYKDGSFEECKQFKKLVQSITASDIEKGELDTVLPEIYYYGIKGEKFESISSLVLDNEESVKRWIEIINELKLSFHH